MPSRGSTCRICCAATTLALSHSKITGADPTGTDRSRNQHIYRSVRCPQPVASLSVLPCRDSVVHPRPEPPRQPHPKRPRPAAIAMAASRLGPASSARLGPLAQWRHLDPPDRRVRDRRHNRLAIRPRAIDAHYRLCPATLLTTMQTRGSRRGFASPGRLWARWQVGGRARALAGSPGVRRGWRRRCPVRPADAAWDRRHRT